jgi:hypothetical protein
MLAMENCGGVMKASQGRDVRSFFTSVATVSQVSRNLLTGAITS